MLTLDPKPDVIALTGRLDVQTVKQAHQALAAVTPVPARFDCRQLEGLDAAGVQWLVWVSQRHQGALSLEGCQKPVRHTLKGAGFEKWVTP